MKSEIAGGIVVLLALGFGWYAYSVYDKGMKEADTEFCQKNLEYFQDFCKTNPDHCKEGPKKKARCE